MIYSLKTQNNILLPLEYCIRATKHMYNENSPNVDNLAIGGANANLNVNEQKGF